jgi:hypothetical protein
VEPISGYTLSFLYGRSFFSADLESQKKRPRQAGPSFQIDLKANYRS